MREAMAVATEFSAKFGTEPAGVWGAPGRVNLIGEHTDYNGGLCLPIAIPQACWVAASLRSDDRVCLHSMELNQTLSVELSEIRPGYPKGWGLYPLGVLWALQEQGYSISGMNLVLHSNVPIGAGLSSSAALEAGVAAAASDLFELGLLDDDAGRAKLATVCQRAENHIAQAPTGGMDQAASLRTKENNALLLDCLDNSTAHIPFQLEKFGLALLLIDTQTKHALVDGQYGARRADCEAAAEILGVDFLRRIDFTQLPEALASLPLARHQARVRHVVSEIARVQQAIAALQEDDFETVGKLFVASHESLARDYEVSCPQLDTAVEEAVSQGALGARMTGGGFGGTAIALVKTVDVAEIEKAIRAAYVEKGFNPPKFYLATACAAARRWI